MVETASQPSSEALRASVDSKHLDIGASNHTIDVIANTWQFTLNWASHNQILAAIALIICGISVILGRNDKRNGQALKLEYEKKRRETASPPVQQSLPFLPDSNEKVGKVDDTH
jgi:hypothetical protein